MLLPRLRLRRPTAASARPSQLFPLLLILTFLALTTLTSASSSPGGPASPNGEESLEKRQTSSAPSFRFSVHTHAEASVKYAISPIYVSLLIGSAGAIVAGLMS